MNRGPLLQTESTTPSGDSSTTHAIEYSKTAALLRRRALQPDRTDEERAELRRRADWYERRSVVKRKRGIMPAELRTPLESLKLVDELRQRLADVVDIARRLSFEELEAFSLSLKVDEAEHLTANSSESTEVAVEDWTDVTVALLSFLGVRQTTDSNAFVFLPFMIRTAVP